MWNKILNPKTGRFVKVNGAIGRKILKKYLMMLRGGSGANNSAGTTISMEGDTAQLARDFASGKKKSQMMVIQEYKLVR